MDGAHKRHCMVFIALTLVVATCGPADNGKPTATRSEERAPPIEATDEPAPTIGDELSDMAPWLKPAPGSTPRSIARLLLRERGANASAVLVVWRTRSGELCFGQEVVEPDGGGSSLPGGPCVARDTPCGELCLERWTDYHEGYLTYFLSGIVSANGESLEIVFEDDTVERFKLTGPLVPGWPQWRVFMLDLDRTIDKQRRLLVHGKVIEEQFETKANLAWEQCLRDSLTPKRAREAEEVFDECADRAEKVGPFGN